MVDSARAQGIPVEPLMEKVYQGLAMGADGPRIIIAVRSLTHELGGAHRALGSVATADEIKAAASAMHAGVPAVEFGPVGGGHHGPDEWVSVESLAHYREALVDFVRTLPQTVGKGHLRIA